MPRKSRPNIRGEIIAAAHAILDEGEYGNLTVDAIARSVKMSKSTLYKHFRDKDDLVIAMIGEACSQTEAALTEAATRDGDARERLSRFGDILADHADRMPRVAFTQRSRLPDTSVARLCRLDRTMVERCAEILEAGRREGCFTIARPAFTATVLLASAMGGIEASGRGEVEVSRGEAVEGTLRLVMPGLMAA